LKKNILKVGPNWSGGVLRAQLDSEKVTYETVPCIDVFLLLA
jgi:hypothetical protein